MDAYSASAAPLLSLEQAQAQILADLQPLGPETLAISHAFGRVSAAAVQARRALPPFANSAMDGYAVRAADLPAAGAALPLQGAVAAGQAAPPTLRPGHCLRIYTGAPLPPGADAIVMQEDVVTQATTVQFRTTPQPGQHIRQLGEDISVGAPLLRSGQVLRAGELGMLASQGQSWISVVTAPRVAILPTGNELQSMDAPLQSGQIVDSNSLLLTALVQDNGGHARRAPPAADTPEAVATALLQAARGTDLLLTCGGVSVGDVDVVRQVLQSLGEVHFWRVAVKPGKPLAYGRVRGVPWIGLPGNPVSSFVGFELFVRPALRRLAGHTEPHRRRRSARLHSSLPASTRRTFWRVRLQREADALWATPMTKQGSGAQSSLLEVDALLDAPPQPEAFSAGTAMPVLVLNPDW